jgi:hypothetical protein
MAGPPSFAPPYLDAARSALDLVRQPEVAERWDDPSALAQMTVGSLAAHLTSQVTSVELTLDHPVDAEGPVAVLEHYTKVAWRGAPLGQETNRSIRRSSEDQARNGPGPLVLAAERSLERLAARLPAADGDTVVQPPWTTWSLRLDDFLVTRLVELSVHADDLAVSVDVKTPELPDGVRRPVRHLLVDLAAQRHGEVLVLRGLSRAERAPDSFTAF